MVVYTSIMVIDVETKPESSGWSTHKYNSRCYSWMSGNSCFAVLALGVTVAVTLNVSMVRPSRLEHAEETEISELPGEESEAR